MQSSSYGKYGTQNLATAHTLVCYKLWSISICDFKESYTWFRRLRTQKSRGLNNFQIKPEISKI